MSNPWMQTFTGKRFDLAEPLAALVDVRDIAHGLARCCRYAGQCNTFYSVAQHSVLVSRQVAPEHALAGLLHDAAEAYVGDLVSPLRRLPELEGYNAVHDRVLRAVFVRFGVGWPLHASVKEADVRLLATEAASWNGLVGETPGWDAWGVVCAGPYPLRIDPWSVGRAEGEFLNEFEKITGEKL